jgi:enoyl-CoA hydratase/carnithine racemase
MTGILETGVEERSWTFTLNRPDKLNALNAELVEALIEGVSKAHEAGARLLVFAGNGKSFSAGFDQGELERESDADLLMRLVRIESLLLSRKGAILARAWTCLPLAASGIALMTRAFVCPDSGSGWC